MGTGVEFCVVYMCIHDGSVSLAARLLTTFGLWFIPESNAVVHSLLMHSTCSNLMKTSSLSNSFMASMMATSKHVKNWISRLPVVRLTSRSLGEAVPVNK